MIVSVETPVLEKIAPGVDLDKLASAIAWAETHNCELGYGDTYNNCFGLKNGSIAPCDKIGNNNMCVYNSPEESYAAFKKVWAKGYGGKFPTLAMAQTWTGSDRADIWLGNVTESYHK